MPSVSGLIRTSGWRQGSFVGRDDTETLLDKSIDQVPSQRETPLRLVVVTQNCDLVQEPNIEPFAELILCREIAEAEPLYENGRNPRLLHIQAIGSRKPDQWLGISIHDRFRVQKITLVDLAVDQSTQLRDHDVRLLSRWIAKRYTRPAFPDELNQRFKTVDGQLERLFKSKDGQIVTGIYLDVSDEEHSQDTPYTISVRITAKAEVWDNHSLRTALQNFEQRLSSILDGCTGIAIAEDDIQTLPEEDLTLADLRRFKRLDRDYRSLPEQGDLGRPVDPRSDF